MDQKGILILTPFFSPNVGGVETHLDDLVKKSTETGWDIYVQTYSPITTPSVTWLAKEERNGVHITRYRWFGKNLFHRIEKTPILDFLYLAPYLLIRAFFFMIKNHKKITIIHAQGLNAALIGVILKKIFRKTLITSIHAVYEVNPLSKTAFFVKEILSCVDIILTLSGASYDELVKLGLDCKKIHVFSYWVDLEAFRPLHRKTGLRRHFRWDEKFTVLFVGRLIEKKGIRELLEVSEKLPHINFVFIGSGPMEILLQKKGLSRNVHFIGRVDNNKLCDYYNMADVFCIPSQYEEGFGRVAMEAVSCGLPVVGSNKGGIPEALDESVALLVEPNVESITKSIQRLHDDRSFFDVLRRNCRKFAEERFSSNNALSILNFYKIASCS